MGLPGFATAEGTTRFATRSVESELCAPGHFRLSVQGLQLSSLGMGTYLGNPDTETDGAVEQAVVDSLQSGAINVVDTAINYRFQRAERAVGRGIQRAIEEGLAERDEIFVSSKIGYLTPDGEMDIPFQQYFQEFYVDTGIVGPGDIVGGGHCMTPAYLANQLERSRANLNLDTIDLMYLHNAAESQLPTKGKDGFMADLTDAFVFLEGARAEGKIQYYGLATWDCFRVMPDAPQFLNLLNVVQLAESIGGAGSHGFRFVQLPFNMAFSEAGTVENQVIDGQWMTFLEAALTLKIGVFASVPLLQGGLLKQPQGLPKLSGLSTDAQTCLQFVRSHPAIIAPLVGHKNPAHVRENLAVAQVPPLGLEGLQEELYSEMHSH